MVACNTAVMTTTKRIMVTTCSRVIVVNDLYMYGYYMFTCHCCQRFIYVNKLSCTTDEGLTTENFGSYHYTILHQNRTLSSFLSIHYWCGKHIFIYIYTQLNVPPISCSWILLRTRKLLRLGGLQYAVMMLWSNNEPNSGSLARILAFL